MRKSVKSMLAAACSLALSGSLYADPGLFDGSMDLSKSESDPAAAGSVVYDGSTYVVSGGGGDWWSDGERGHFVYKAITGDFRLEANISNLRTADGYEGAIQEWAKFGLAFRNTLDTGDDTLSTEVNAIIAAMRPDRLGATFQFRDDANGGMGDNTTTGMPSVAQKLALQRIDSPFGYYVQGFIDRGAGWQTIGSRFMANMSDSGYVGLAVISHDNGVPDYTDPPTPDPTANLVSADFSNVQFVDPVAPTSFKNVPVTAALRTNVDDLRDPGVMIHAIKRSAPWDWNTADQLLQTGTINAPGTQEGSRLDQVVNLFDTDNHGNFSGPENMEKAFPGIDADGADVNQSGGAGGDDDNDFACEATGYIALTAGWHRITVRSDDGTIIKIGGVEIGRTNEWQGAGDNWDFIFTVESDGIYDFRAFMLEGGGGASFELSDFDGANRVLLGLGDGMKFGQSYAVPEPATLSMLAVGALGLMARRRKA